MQRHPIRLALAFEAGLAVFALLLALAFGLRPWLALEFTAGALLQSLVASAVLIAAMLLLMRLRWPTIRELDRFVREHLVPLFRDAGPLAIGAVALAAGVGEELLFRGLLQDGLSGVIGPLAALITASAVFGLAHAVSPAYFVIASVIGVYLGGLYLATGNLLVPIVVHFVYDWAVLWRYIVDARRS